LNISRGARDDAEDRAGRRLLLQPLIAFAGPLVELLLEIGRRGTAGAPNGRLLAAVGLCCLSAARPHSYSTHRCADLASGLLTSAIDVTSGQPLMKPSLDLQDHARGTEIYHLRADV
jgi:hypothetical protein